MKILKFGGSSVGSQERVLRVVDLIKGRAEKERIAVVVSAFGGITDQLIAMAETARTGEWAYTRSFQEFERRHVECAKDSLDGSDEIKAMGSIRTMIAELEDILHGIYLIKEVTPRTMDVVVSFGERLSAYILSEVLKHNGVEADFLDARRVVRTDDSFGSAHVDFETTYAAIAKYFDEHKALQVITGFIGATVDDETTTLGRGGSDYSASLFGAALKASEVEIWTDVDGVMTADPRIVPAARTVESLTYEEAMELSHFGAKVIYPPTMAPLLRANIPIIIKNTFNPEFEGTRIAADSTENGYIIKGISSIRDVALLRLEGSGLIGVPGISMRLFGALAAKKINIILITQASSEHSICFAIDPKELNVACKAIESEFRFEMQAQQIDPIVVEQNLSIIAIVGRRMRKQVGLSGKLFGCLGRAGINVVAIVQGSSELNISVAVGKDDIDRAMNVIHDEFFVADFSELHLFIVGTGLVGGTLLDQISMQAPVLKSDYGLNLQVHGISDSQKMLLDENGIDMDIWRDMTDQKGELTDLDLFISKMCKMRFPNSVFVDCTSSDKVVSHYQDIISKGISIVTPNKKANTSSMEMYNQLHASYAANVASLTRPRFLYETNVGAGLPVISTLKDMLLTGDLIHKIEGVFSGTLSYIFNRFDGSKPFSEIVQEAREKGYTEPDPREDLNGMDVARKLLILARECGFSVEMEDISVESLLSEEALNAESIEEFFEILKKSDKDLEKRRKKAADKGLVLRYIASFRDGEAQVSLMEVSPDHPFYALGGSENVISFTTKRYHDTPLVIKGPGAGAEVTAAGVFADILKIAGSLLPAVSHGVMVREHEGLKIASVYAQKDEAEDYVI